MQLPLVTRREGGTWRMWPLSQLAVPRAQRTHWLAGLWRQMSPLGTFRRSRAALATNSRENPHNERSALLLAVRCHRLHVQRWLAVSAPRLCCRKDPRCQDARPWRGPAESAGCPLLGLTALRKRRRTAPVLPLLGARGPTKVSKRKALH